MLYKSDYKKFKKIFKENENDSAIDLDELYSPTVTSKRLNEFKKLDHQRSIDMIIEE